MNLLVIVDLDMTIADVSSLAAQAGPEPTRENRMVYRMWADTMTSRLLSAPPNEPVLELVRSLYRGGAHVLYLTSREESHREVSQQWLNKVAAPAGTLIMRPYEDWRSTAEFKNSVIIGLLEKHAGHAVAVDDDSSNEMTPVYQSHGISHLRVMDFLGAWEEGSTQKVGQG